MLSVLIVEDEPIARESLRYLIDWEEHGFAVKGAAEDGEQALAMLRDEYYSLVLTDIRMPKVNGLELAERMREFSDAAVIILSGYDDFEYARQGLKLGVKEYLLKPVDEDDLVKALSHIRQELTDRDLLQRRQQAGHYAYREQFLRRMALGQSLNRKEYLEHSAMAGFPEDRDVFRCLSLEIDFVNDAPPLTDRDAELKRYAVRNILDELASSAGGFVFEDAEDRYGMIYAGNAGELDDESVRGYAERIGESILMYAKETASIGIGPAVSGHDRIAESYSAAEAAVDGKFLVGAGSILWASERQGDGRFSPELRTLEEEVLLAMKDRRLEAALQALDRLWEGFKSSEVAPGEVKRIVLEILVQLFRLVRDAGASYARLFDYQLGDYEYVMKAKTIDDLLAFMGRRCSDVLEQLQRVNEIRPKKVFDQMKLIVEEQYASAISLKSVAQQVYMNPNYLGKLFKAHADLSFNDYVLKVRMEKAKELLLHTDKKVYEIAEEVGFGELDWFYKRFKAYTGVSASEFKSSILAKE